MALPATHLSAVPAPPSAAEHLQRQRAYFETGETRPYAFRARQLAALRAAIVAHEQAFTESLARDLRKAATEAYATEIGFTLAEIDHVAGHLKSWMKPRRTMPSLVVLPGSTRIHPEPLGVSLILGAWNYPMQLVLAPLIGAIAAGCCATIKPSELSPATAQVVADLVAKTFDPKYVHVVLGGVQESEELLKHRWDQIFFTGSPAVGRIVAQAAAKHLTPVVLELGGKSPCIVDEDVDVDVAARRIAWGKFINAGQTCVAPDYLLVHEAVKDRLVTAIAREVTRFYGEDPKQSPDFPRIVNDRHFTRLEGYLKHGTVACGGQCDAAERYIAPTVLTDVKPDCATMQDELFGPILPVLTWRTLDEAIRFVRDREKPLALYFFTRDDDRADRVVEETSAGGVVINDVAMHLGAPSLPFGGVGMSGNGRYHGRYSFEAFSHQKAVLRKPFQLDVPIRYPPYTSGALKLFKRLLG